VTKPPIHNVAASVRRRLLNLAQERGDEFQLVPQAAPQRSIGAPAPGGTQGAMANRRSALARRKSKPIASSSRASGRVITKRASKSGTSPPESTGPLMECSKIPPLTPAASLRRNGPWVGPTVASRVVDLEPQPSL